MERSNVFISNSATVTGQFSPDRSTANTEIHMEMNQSIVRFAIIGFIAEITNGSLDRADRINKMTISEQSIAKYRAPFDGGPYTNWASEYTQRLYKFLEVIGVDAVELRQWSHEHGNAPLGTVNYSSIGPAHRYSAEKFADSIIKYMCKKHMF